MIFIETLRILTLVIDFILNKDGQRRARQYQRYHLGVIRLWTDPKGFVGGFVIFFSNCSAQLTLSPSLIRKALLAAVDFPGLLPAARDLRLHHQLVVTLTLAPAGIVEL